MKVSAVSVYNNTRYSKTNNTKNLQKTMKTQDVSFKGPGGGVFGFMVGGAAGLALTALALTNPVGWAGLALYAGTAAGGPCRQRIWHPESASHRTLPTGF